MHPHLIVENIPFFLSLSVHVCVSDDITALRSEVKLFHPGGGGLTTRHKLEHGVYQNTSKITSDHNKHPEDRNCPIMHI